MSGESDLAQCFCCGLGVYSWEPGEDPWTEHAHHRPKCQYIIREKGEKFVVDAQAMFNDDLQVNVHE